MREETDRILYRQAGQGEQRQGQGEQGELCGVYTPLSWCLIVLEVGVLVCYISVHEPLLRSSRV